MVATIYIYSLYNIAIYIHNEHYSFIRYAQANHVHYIIANLIWLGNHIHACTLNL